MRAFVALDVDAPSRDALARLSTTLGESAPRGLRFLAPSTFHVTLKFLGAIDDAVVPALSSCLAPLAAAAPRAASIAALTAFSSPARASFIVAELSDPDRAATKLAAALEEIAAPLGVARESRPFRPHLTLARARRPLDARAWLASLPPPPSALVRFSGVALYRSDLLAQGPVYTPLAIAALAPQ